MQGKKLLYLFLALLLPVLVFLFLKFFGKNEFAVKPLYSDTLPEVQTGCPQLRNLPYHIPDSVMRQLTFEQDTLLLIGFGELTQEGVVQLRRIHVEFEVDAFQQMWFRMDNSKAQLWKKCVFFLTEPFDLVLVDKKGLIKGEYVSNDREEIDRLITELSIILKKY